jgi:hypothetical protein
MSAWHRQLDDLKRECVAATVVTTGDVDKDLDRMVAAIRTRTMRGWTIKLSRCIEQPTGLVSWHFSAKPASMANGTDEDLRSIAEYLGSPMDEVDGALLNKLVRGSDVKHWRWVEALS